MHQFGQTPCDFGFANARWANEGKNATSVENGQGVDHRDPLLQKGLKMLPQSLAGAGRWRQGLDQLRTQGWRKARVQHHAQCLGLLGMV